jgi:hypothetical protein
VLRNTAATQNARTRLATLRRLFDAEKHRRKGAVLDKNLTGAVHGCRPIEVTCKIQSRCKCKYLLKKFGLE